MSWYTALLACMLDCIIYNHKYTYVLYSINLYMYTHIFQCIYIHIQTIIKQMQTFIFDIFAHLNHTKKHAIVARVSTNPSVSCIIFSTCIKKSVWITLVSFRSLSKR